MTKYVKKPVVIDAVRYDGSNAAEVLAWAEKGGTRERIDPETGKHYTALSIPTLEGLMQASPGDWIIKGVVGEVYPCKDEVFQLTYEPLLVTPLSTPPAVGGVIGASAST